jgi:hypothetical protein
VSDVAAVSLRPAGDLLMGEDNAAAALGRSLNELGAAETALRGVRHLSGTALRTIDDEVGRMLGGLLDIDVGDALVMGWRKHRALTGAARRTLAAPAREEVVVLATHRITWTTRPTVDLFVADLRVNSFEFELRLVLDVIGLTAVIRAGHLVGLRGGECEVAATLTLEGGVLARREQRLDLGRTLWLRHAVELVDPADVDVPAAPV